MGGSCLNLVTYSIIFVFITHNNQSNCHIVYLIRFALLF